MVFSERLKELRDKNNISQRILNEKLHFPPNRINRMECQMAWPTIFEVNIIAGYFRVKAAWLAFGEGSANDEAVNH